MIARTVTLVLMLFVFWLAMSGHYTGFLIAAGAVASVLIGLLTRRKQSLDAESVPLEVFFGMFTYWPWLFWEIVKSSISVARVVLQPRMQISPTMTVVDTRLKTAIGVATYANSITLTPGTVTCGVKGNRLTVYALVRGGALDIESGGMEDQVARFEGNG